MLPVVLGGGFFVASASFFGCHMKRPKFELLQRLARFLRDFGYDLQQPARIDK
jgi:hypothetical protein